MSEPTTTELIYELRLHVGGLRFLTNTAADRLEAQERELKLAKAALEAVAHVRLPVADRNTARPQLSAPAGPRRNQGGVGMKDGDVRYQEMLLEQELLGHLPDSWERATMKMLAENEVLIDVFELHVKSLHAALVGLRAFSAGESKTVLAKLTGQKP